MILDDIGYVQYSREEMEVLFALCERMNGACADEQPAFSVGRRSSRPDTTAAAIDRLCTTA